MTFFAFEADFVDSLRCIPMQVRYKLDTCGVKMKLSHWHQLTEAERQNLVDLPCTTETEIKNYHDYLQNLILERTGTPASELPIEPHPPWLDITKIPDDLQLKAQELGVNISLAKWQNLTSLQRFALLKLSRPGHENKNFPHAIAEFQL